MHLRNNRCYYEVVIRRSVAFTDYVDGIERTTEVVRRYKKRVWATSRDQAIDILDSQIENDFANQQLKYDIREIVSLKMV